MAYPVHQEDLDSHGWPTVVDWWDAGHISDRDRPLTSSSDDPNDLEPLTPSHILLLRSNVSLPPGIFDRNDRNSVRRWRQAQYLANVFWRRWIKGYILTLQDRQKWLKQGSNFVRGDLVLIASDNVPRGQWPLGRVLEGYPDRTDVVRTALVHTAMGNLHRPVTRLCLLGEATHVNDSASGAQVHDTIDQREESEDKGKPREVHIFLEDSGAERPLRANRAKRPGYLADYVWLYMS